MKIKNIGTTLLILTSLSLSAAASDIEAITTEQAPKAIGPYSQAVMAGKTLYISGQIGVDPTTGKLAGENIEDQARQVFKNIKAILAVKGLSFENVVRVDVDLKDLTHFKAMNEIYGEFFSKGVRPARKTIQAANLPMSALIEVTCIAYQP